MKKVKARNREVRRIGRVVQGEKRANGVVAWVLRQPDIS